MGLLILAAATRANAKCENATVASSSDHIAPYSSHSKVSCNSPYTSVPVLSPFQVPSRIESDPLSFGVLASGNFKRIEVPDCSDTDGNLFVVVWMICDPSKNSQVTIQVQSGAVFSLEHAIELSYEGKTSN